MHDYIKVQHTTVQIAHTIYNKYAVQCTLTTQDNREEAVAESGGGGGGSTGEASMREVIFNAAATCGRRASM